MCVIVVLVDCNKIIDREILIKMTSNTVYCRTDGVGYGVFQNTVKSFGFDHRRTSIIDPTSLRKQLYNHGYCHLTYHL